MKFWYNITTNLRGESNDQRCDGEEREGDAERGGSGGAEEALRDVLQSRRVAGLGAQIRTLKAEFSEHYFAARPMASGDTAFKNLHPRRLYQEGERMTKES